MSLVTRKPKATEEEKPCAGWSGWSPNLPRCAAVRWGAGTGLANCVSCSWPLPWAPRSCFWCWPTDDPDGHRAGQADPPVRVRDTRRRREGVDEHALTWGNSEVGHFTPTERSLIELTNTTRRPDQV